MLINWLAVLTFGLCILGLISSFWCILKQQFFCFTFSTISSHVQAFPIRFGEGGGTRKIPIKHTQEVRAGVSTFVASFPGSLILIENLGGPGVEVTLSWLPTSILPTLSNYSTVPFHQLASNYHTITRTAHKTQSSQEMECIIVESVRTSSMIYVTSEHHNNSIQLLMSFLVVN